MSDLEFRDDPNMNTHEKEVSINVSRVGDRFNIHSEISTVTKWLFNHPEFVETHRRESQGVVYAISGTLPMGVLKLSGSSRKDHTMSAVLGQLPENGDES